MKNALFISLIFLILSSALIIAQDNDSTDDNWCYEGNVWGDGRCNDPDEFINQYNWVSGWCSAQIENGNYEGTFYECMNIPEPQVELEAEVEGNNVAVAVDDLYFVGCEPFFNVGVPGVLTNDIGEDIEVISSSTGGNPDLIINMSTTGDFDASFTEPGIFTFTYTITGGSEATVTLNNLCS
jgi:hypothetical protein